MKTTIFVLLFAALSLCGAEMNLRSCKLDSSRMLTITKGGKSNFNIKVGKSPASKFAARELEKFLKKATGAGASKTGQITFCVGISPEGVDLQKLPRDGYVIRAVGNTIYIAGRDDRTYEPLANYRPTGDMAERATLFGVYDFLERFTGARFVFPGEIGEYVRKTPDLRIPAMDISERPDNTVRDWSWTAGKQPMQDARLSSYRLRHQTTLIPNCHGLGRLGYIERFGEKHPEYFAVKPNGSRDTNYNAHMAGQLCYSSPVTEEIYQDAKAYLTGVPPKTRGVYVRRFKCYTWDWNAAYKDMFNVMPQDGMTGCCCAKCQALASTDPDWRGNQVWKLTADWQNRLKKEGVKGRLTQMAYGHLSKVPPFDIPPEILIQAAFTGPWAIGRSTLWTKQHDNLKAWTKKLRGKIYLWNYICKYGGTNIPDLPCNTPRAVAKYYSLVAPEIYGAYLESGVDRPAFQYFNWYVFSKMMWNNKIDGEKLYEETCRDFFGAASADMLRFFDKLENVWLTKICSNVVMTVTGPRQVAPNERDLWEKIYTPALREELRKIVKQAERKVQKDRDSLKRVRWFANEYLGSLDRAAQKFAVQQDARTLVSCVIADSRAQAQVLSLARSGDAPTAVRVWKSADKLFIEAQCTEPDMKSVLIQKYPADSSSLWMNNSMEIFLDPKGSGREFYQFMISSDGQMSDLKFDGANHDMKWSSHAELKLANTAKGWGYTLAIPLKSLQPFPKDYIGADFVRSRVLKGKKVLYTRWSPFVKQNGDVRNFGMLYLKKPQSANLLSDSDFGGRQNGRIFGKWWTSPKDQRCVEYDKNDFMFGKQSLKLTNPDKRNLNVMQYIKGLKSGKKYRVRAFVKTDLKEKDAFLQLNNGFVNVSFPNSGIFGKTPWTAYIYEFTAPQGVEKRQPYIRLYSYYSSGVAWFDGVTIEEIK